MLLVLPGEGPEIMQSLSGERSAITHCSRNPYKPLEAPLEVQLTP